MALIERGVEKGGKVFWQRVHNLSQNRTVTCAVVGTHRPAQVSLCRHCRWAEDNPIAVPVQNSQRPGFLENAMKRPLIWRCSSQLGITNGKCVCFFSLFRHKKFLEDKREVCVQSMIRSANASTLLRNSNGGNTY